MSLVRFDPSLCLSSKVIYFQSNCWLSVILSLSVLFESVNEPQKTRGINGSVKDEEEDEEGLKFVLAVYVKLTGGKKFKRSYAEF